MNRNEQFNRTYTSTYADLRKEFFLPPSSGGSSIGGWREGTSRDRVSALARSISRVAISEAKRIEREAV